MKNLFIEDNDEICINLFVGTYKDGTIFCEKNEEMLLKSMSGLVDPVDCMIESYEIKFKKPSFGDSINLYGVIFGDKSSSFNPVAARFNIMVELAKEWNLTDNKEFVKPTEEQIKKLHPVIASFIGIQLDAEIGGSLN